MRTSDCQAFRRFLDESAEHQALPAVLLAHVDLCAACRREWAAHREMMAALQPGPVPELPPDFAARVMARLPQAAPRASRVDTETVLLIVMLLAGLLTAWISLPPSFKAVLAYERIAPYLDPARAWLTRMLAGVVAACNKALPESLGEQFFAQSWKLVFISLVTLLVAKIALLFENRLRRPLR